MILERDFQLSGKDTQTNIKLPFFIEGGCHVLKIEFHYGPGQSCDQEARDQVREAIHKYSLTESDKDQAKIEDFLPVENFITLSLSREGEYLGGYHNKDKDQEIVITREFASLGFIPVDQLSGHWEVQLNCHCIASDNLQAGLRIGAHYEA